MKSPVRALVDLAVVRDNVAALAGHAPSAQVMAVVKADAYGHGLVPCAQAALAGGATWLGVAQATEALELRAAGITAPVLAWIYSPHTDLDELVLADVDVSISGAWALDQVLAAARRTGRTARVHLKVDTGLGRSGIPAREFPAVLAAAVAEQAAGAVDVVGVFSHLAWADAPDHPTVVRQAQVFADAVREAERAGAHLEVRHLANSAATLTNPAMHFDLVRPGIAVYGLSPVPDIGGPERFGLVPAMRLEAELALTKSVPGGHGVSYGHAYVTPAETVLGVVPLGYADGIPRHASGHDGIPGAPVQVGDRWVGIAGRVCMDQFVLDLGPGAIERTGDTVVLFGPGADGSPTAEDWARAAGTISYEIVSRLGVRVPREYVGTQIIGAAEPGSARAEGEGL